MKYFSILFVIVISLYFYMNHTRDVRQLEINHVSRLLSNFRTNLEFYSHIAKEPVISTNLAITIDKIIATLQAESKIYYDYDGISMLEEIRDGKDVYGNEYSYSVDIKSGEVTLMAVHTPSNVKKNLQSVANIDFGEVKVVDVNGNQVQIGEQ